LSFRCPLPSKLNGRAAEGFTLQANLGSIGGRGVGKRYKPVPLDITLEWRPNLVVTPDTDLEVLDFTAHVRFGFD